MFAISPTDNNWFQFLKGVESNSYVNFWTPTPWNVNNLGDSDRWYFLLKSPIREIAGFGEFVEYKNLTAEEAWREFGQRNGRIDKHDFLKSIQRYLDKNSSEFGGVEINAESYKIGCVVLKNCEFWDDENFKKPLDYNIDFAKQVVKFKYFNQPDPFEKNRDTNEAGFELLNQERDINKREINLRVGQGVFKGKLLKAYGNKCCISGETCPELLEGAHLQRYLSVASNHVQNGLLLRIDLHKLLDSGLLYIDQEYKVHISSLVKSLSYKQFDNTTITLPDNKDARPSKNALLISQNNFRE